MVGVSFGFLALSLVAVFSLGLIEREVPSHVADLSSNATVIAPAAVRPTIRLTATSGQEFDFSTQTAGRLTVLMFSDDCPDRCAAALDAVNEARAVPGIPNVLVVYVASARTPATPRALRAYLDRFGDGSVGLTGTSDELRQARRAALGGGSDGSLGPTVAIVVFTSDDRAHVSFGASGSVADWINDLSKVATIDWPAP
jgi:cytochrome oxidase Cu insertion factor (SCO1/SenC/PrrC family)